MPADPIQPLTLLRAARRGDEGAARALWDRFAPRLRALSRLLLDPHFDQDIVQSVFVELLRLPDARVDSIRDFAAYVVIATRNACRAASRSRARERERRSQVVRLVREQAAPPDDHLDTLRRALDRLDDDSRELLVLRNVAGLTFEQISQSLNVPRGTIVGRYGSALESLRAVLSDDTPTEATASPHRAAATDVARVGGRVQP